jgi:hypothetical protein
MKRTKLSKATKLTLNSETIRELASSSLSGVGGGTIWQVTNSCLVIGLTQMQSGGTRCKTNL